MRNDLQMNVQFINVYDIICKCVYSHVFQISDGILFHTL